MLAYLLEEEEFLPVEAAPAGTGRSAPEQRGAQSPKLSGISRKMREMRKAFSLADERRQSALSRPLTRAQSENCASGPHTGENDADFLLSCIKQHENVSHQNLSWLVRNGMHHARPRHKNFSVLVAKMERQLETRRSMTHIPPFAFSSKQNCATIECESVDSERASFVSQQMFRFPPEMSEKPFVKLDRAHLPPSSAQPSTANFAADRSRARVSVRVQHKMLCEDVEIDAIDMQTVHDLKLRLMAKISKKSHKLSSEEGLLAALEDGLMGFFQCKSSGSGPTDPRNAQPVAQNSLLDALDPTSM